MKPTISVIVPVYNVEKYLRKCVDSVLDQTYVDLEVILVDDGSPDNCGVICDNYARSDARIKVIHKQNGGLSDARNAGLEVATGEYITFVDSDDWLDLELYQMAMERAPFAVLVFGCTDVDASSGVMTENRLHCETGSIQWRSDARLVEQLVKQSLFGYSCNKIYHRPIIGDTRFKNIPLREDMLFNLTIFSKTKSIAVLDMPGYFYFHHESSLLTGTYSGPVPVIIPVAHRLASIHPDLGKRQNNQITNLIIKTYLTDILRKYVFLNRQLTEEDRITVVRSIVSDSKIRAHLRLRIKDCPLFLIFTLCCKLRAPTMLYRYLERIWRP